MRGQHKIFLKILNFVVVVVQSLSCMHLFVTPWAAHQASLSFTVSQSFAETHVHWVGDAIQHLILCCLLLLLPSIFPSIRVFSNESSLCIGWPKYWSFSFSISPSREYSGLISFRIGWFDLPAAQGTLKSLLQHHSSKVSILWRSAFFMVQLSHPYMISGKTIFLTILILVGKVMFLLFNVLSRLVIAFLLRSKCLFNFIAVVTICSDFGAQENNICTVSIVSPSVSMKWWDRMPWS